jgi:hypothetical protein
MSATRAEYSIGTERQRIFGTNKLPPGLSSRAARRYHLDNGLRLAISAFVKAHLDNELGEIRQFREFER